MWGSRNEYEGLITVFAPRAVPQGPQYELYLSCGQTIGDNRKVKAH